MKEPYGYDPNQTVPPAPLNHRQKKMIEFYEDPLWPKLCRFFFYGLYMIVGMSLIVDLNSYMRYERTLGLGHLYDNLVTTGFFGWMALSLPLIVISLMAMCVVRKKMVERMRGVDLAQSEEEDVISKVRFRAAYIKNTRLYRFYIKQSLVGIILTAILYLLHMIIL